MSSAVKNLFSVQMQDLLPKAIAFWIIPKTISSSWYNLLRFIEKEAVTEDEGIADILYFLDEEKIAQEAQYDGLYAVCTDFFKDTPESILKISESRWQI